MTRPEPCDPAPLYRLQKRLYIRARVRQYLDAMIETTFVAACALLAYAAIVHPLWRRLTGGA